MNNNYPYFILEIDQREKFLKICEKMNISRQAITDSDGYYNLLIRHNYNPKAIENIKVKLHDNVTNLTPLYIKRNLFIVRHLAEYKPDHLRRLLSFIAWAFVPPGLSRQQIREIIDRLYNKYFHGRNA